MKTFLASLIIALTASLWSSIGFASLFGTEPEVLPVEEALKYELETTDTQLLIHWQFADTAYLYKDKLKLSFEDKSPYNAFAFNREAKIIEDPAFGTVAVFYNGVTTAIDRTKLPTGQHVLTLKYQGCLESVGICYPPQTTVINIESALGTQTAFQADIEEKSLNLEALDSPKDIANFMQQTSLFWVFLIILILGLTLTFTPCVLPMMPIISSIIAGQKELSSGKGFVLSSVYVLGMALAFAIAGVIVGLLGARFNIQIYMQQPWVLTTFGILFVLLALSMFGLYELRLPRFIQDPLDKLNQNQKGGSLASVFFMGVISAIVVSPCVSAPVAGILLFISLSGDATLGGLALFTLGIGMGIPLILLGTLGASFLPKAGQWMEKVKVFFGVMLLVVAWWIMGRVLPESVYMIGWALLAGIYGVVLGAFEPAKTGLQRTIKGIGLIGFVLCVLLLAKTLGVSQGQLIGYTANPNESGPSTSPSFFQTVSSEAQLNQALQQAYENQEIVFIDVYAKWCIECEIMSKTLFSDPEVVSALKPFATIKFDITDFNRFHQDYLTSLKIPGPPALLFYGLDGSYLTDAQIVGEISKSDFLNHLDQFDHSVIPL